MEITHAMSTGLGPAVHWGWEGKEEGGGQVVRFYQDVEPRRQRPGPE